MTQKIEPTLQSFIAWTVSYHGIQTATQFFVPNALRAFFIDYPDISYRALVPEQYCVAETHNDTGT